MKETALKIEKNRKRRCNIAVICGDKEKLDSFVIRKLISFSKTTPENTSVKAPILQKTGEN